MPNIVSYIVESWRFMLRQSALWHVALWLGFVPLVLTNLVPLPHEGHTPEQVALIVVAHLALIVLLLWGEACILTVGRRFLQAKAGRTRTSFKAVRFQARRLIIPLLLTDILRWCITALWGLPLIAAVAIGLVYADARDLTPVEFFRAYPWAIVPFILLLLPPLIYLVKTALSPLVIAYEKTAFRPALKRATVLARGRFFQVLFVCFLLGFILLILPSFIVGLILEAALSGKVQAYALAIGNAAIGSIMYVLWLLSLTLYFKDIGGKTKGTDMDNGI